MYSGVFSQIMPCLDGLTDNAIVQHSEGTYGWAKTIAQGDLTPNQGGFVTDIYAIAIKHCPCTYLDGTTRSVYRIGYSVADEKKGLCFAQCKALRGYFYFMVVSVL